MPETLITRHTLILKKEMIRHEKTGTTLADHYWTSSRTGLRYYRCLLYTSDAADDS